jgi:hypothetical protein
MEDAGGSWKPPYFSFATFWSFMGDLASKPLPPKIDRMMLKSKSGTDQANLMLALRSFDLVDDTYMVNAASLGSIAQGDEESRAKALGALVRHYYPDALALSEQNGTEGQLHDLFRDKYGLTSSDTRRKAVTFFLHIARKAGIPLSEHFPSSRPGSGSPGTPRQTRAPSQRRKNTSGTGDVPVVTTDQTSTGERKTVSFGDAGMVTVTVDVKWLDLADNVFTGLRKVIRDLEALGTVDSPPKSKAGAEATATEVDEP